MIRPDSRSSVFCLPAAPVYIAMAWALAFPAVATAADRYNGLAYTSRGHALASRGTRQANRHTTAERRRAEAVADAGFDALVPSKWEPLMAGKRVSAAFLLPSRQDFLEVNIRQQRSDAARLGDQGATHRALRRLMS
jgi:hypothetical protein